jgi:hypothetical protein
MLGTNIPPPGMVAQEPEYGSIPDLVGGQQQPYSEMPALNRY